MRTILPFMLAGWSLLQVAPVRAENEVVARWFKRLEAAEADLLSGKFKAAKRIATGVRDDMLNRLGPGDDAGYVLGAALVYVALADAAEGRVEDALWYWHVALGLHPALADTALDRFGAAGALLRDHPPRTPLLPIEDDPDAPIGAVVEPPVVKKSPRPKYPAGALQFRSSGPLVVQVVIGPDGSVSSPVIVQPLPAPTLAYAALDAVRRWRFEAGRLNGQPVEVFYTLTVNFALDDW